MPTTSSVVDKPTKCQLIPDIDRPISVAELRQSIRFRPARVRLGDTIGYFTVKSDPVESTDHDRCHVSCRSWHPDRVVMHIYADMLCDCGWIIPRVEIRGDRYQRISCGHERGMPPDHFYARNWVLNSGAYRMVA